jgi:hypothetical protein
VKGCAGKNNRTTNSLRLHATSSLTHRQYICIYVQQRQWRAARQSTRKARARGPRAYSCSCNPASSVPAWGHTLDARVSSGTRSTYSSTSTRCGVACIHLPCTSRMCEATMYPWYSMPALIRACAGCDEPHTTQHQRLLFTSECFQSPGC